VNLYRTSVVCRPVMHISLSVAEHGLHIPRKPSRCVCEHVIILTFEFDKFGRAGFFASAPGSSP
jgi:hypothetical protein